MIDIDIMRRMWPHGDIKVPSLVASTAAHADEVFARYGFQHPLEISHAFAQISHECDAGAAVVESLNYSAAGLMKTWPSRFDEIKSAAFAHDQRRIANEVYGGRMGNRSGTDDGWTYRGRGGTQVTGHDGYQRLSKKVGLDLVNEPDLVNHPDHFLECAIADFVLCGCLPFAKNDDVGGVTYHLNGGHIGIDDRKSWLARWKVILQGGVQPDGNTTWLQETLNKLGAEPNLVVDGSYGPATVAEVKFFQKDHALECDGRFGPLTLAALQTALASRTV